MDHAVVFFLLFSLEFQTFKPVNFYVMYERMRMSL